MNEQNVNYLKLQLKYLGFGEVLNAQLETAIKNPEIRDFSLKAQSAKPTKMGNTSQFELYFSENSETGNYYLPRYRTDLLDRDGNPSRSNYFGVYQTKSVRAMESVNMLEGRSVRTLRKEGVEENVVYAKLDFNKRTQHGNYRTDYTNAERYGIDVAAIVEKSHVILDNEDQKQQLVKSLEKGNLAEARFYYNGKIEDGFVSLNTQYKNFDYYEHDLKPAYSKLVGEQVERENRGAVEIAPEDELEMRNVEIVKPSEADRLLKSVMGRDGSQDHLAVRLADLTDKQTEKVSLHFREGQGNPPALSGKQMESVPDVVDGNKLSEDMKQRLLYGLEVTVQPNLVYQAATDRSVERVIQSGEAERANRSKVLPEDVVFSNGRSMDPKPWENGQGEEVGEKAGIAR